MNFYICGVIFTSLEKLKFNPLTAKDAIWHPRGITHLRIVYQLFIINFRTQCANSEKAMPLWGRLLG